MNIKNPLQSFFYGKASPKQIIKSYSLCISKEYSLAQDTWCMQEQLDYTFCLDCLDVINPTGQIRHSCFLYFQFRMEIFPSWPFTSLLPVKSNKTGVLESAASHLVTAYRVTADGICSMQPNARWRLLRAQKTLKIISKCLESTYAFSRECVSSVKGSTQIRYVNSAVTYKLWILLSHGTRGNVCASKSLQKDNFSVRTRPCNYYFKNLF